jgi:ubiquinone/menaquinone biosynthesis C-methylase UbiE
VSSAADGYEGRIGRYTADLAAAFIRASGLSPGQRVLDVGCGSGALTQPLAELLGCANVSAVDPDTAAVAAARQHVPGADIRVASAETLPYADGEFDAVLAQLVLGLVDDADAGAQEMRRVARPGGLVAACVWDFRAGMTVLRTFWDAATKLDPSAASRDQAHTRPFGTREELRTLWHAAGLTAVSTGALRASAGYADFADLWGSLVAPDGPPGAYHSTLAASEQALLQGEVWRRLGCPRGYFRLSARAWYVAGRT